MTTRITPRAGPAHPPRLAVWQEIPGHGVTAAVPGDRALGRSRNKVWGKGVPEAGWSAAHGCGLSESRLESHAVSPTMSSTTIGDSRFPTPRGSLLSRRDLLPSLGPTPLQQGLGCPGRNMCCVRAGGAQCQVPWSAVLQKASLLGLGIKGERGDSSAQRLLCPDSVWSLALVMPHPDAPGCAGGGTWHRDLAQLSMAPQNPSVLRGTCSLALGSLSRNGERGAGWLSLVRRTGNGRRALCSLQACAIPTAFPATKPGRVAQATGEATGLTRV